MKQRYTGICKNEENLYSFPHEYSSRLLMIYIEPRPGQNKVIYCCSLDELARYIDDKSIILRHSQVEVKHNFRTGGISEIEMKQFLSFKNEQLYNRSNWIYLLPYPPNTFVDSSFIDCINQNYNTIKLSLSEEKVYVYRNKASEGVSAMSQVRTDIYKATPVDRCSVLNELKLDFKCDESNVFVDNEIIETVDQPVNEWIGSMVNDAVESAWSSSTANTKRREREQKFAAQQGHELKHIMINGVEVKEETTKDNRGRIKKITRSANGHPFSNDELPSEEKFMYFSYINNPELKISVERLWKNENDQLHREIKPAKTRTVNNVVTNEYWYFDGVPYRDDDEPTSIGRYMNSGRIEFEAWYDDENENDDYDENERSKIFIHYYNIEGSPVEYKEELDDNGGCKAEGFYENGMKKYNKDGNELVMYSPQDSSIPILVIDKSQEKFIQLANDDIIREINGTVVSIMNSNGLIRSIDSPGINDLEEDTADVSVIDYKQKNGLFYKRVSKSFVASRRNHPYFKYISLAGFDDAVVVNNEDGSESQEIGYAPINDERTEYKMNTIQINILRDVYTVDTKNPDAIKTTLTLPIDHDSEDFKRETSFKIENKNGEIIQIEGKKGFDKLKKIKIDLNRIQQRDNMWNSSILNELMILQHYNRILTDWNDREFHHNTLQYFFETIEQDNGLLFNNCAEYDDDPYWFEGSLSFEPFERLLNRLNTRPYE